MDKKYFTCADRAVEYLTDADPLLGAHMERIGRIERSMTPDLFEGLAGSIVGQQISGKAADTVSGRIRGLVGRVTPGNIMAADPSALQKCGISMRKTSYIRSAAEAFLDGTVPVTRLLEMDDEDVIALLDALPGVGRWTAEMLLIFSLGRQNILAYDDLGIRKGIMKVYGMETVTRPAFERLREIYSPYGSTASLYLWHIASE